MGTLITRMLLVLTLLAACRTLQPRITGSSANTLYEPPLASGKKGMATPGKYLGYLRLKQNQKKVPFSWDLIAESAAGDEAKFRLIAKINLGSFDSEEFISSYFDQVTYDNATKKLTFGSAVTNSWYAVEDAQLRSNSLLVGKLVNAAKDEIGDFVLLYAGKRRNTEVTTRLKTIFPNNEVLGSLEGVYRGTCEKEPATLQLETSRWAGRQSESKNLLATYKITGRFGVADKTICGQENQACSKGAFEDGRYDFLAGNLNLKGRPGSKHCKFAGKELQCDGGCSFVKDQSNELEKSLFQVANRMERDDGFTVGARDKVAEGAPQPELEGEFFGYLFHEFTGVHQLMRFKVDTKKSSQPGNTNSVATLFFGDGNSKEFIVYRFAMGEAGNPSSKYVFDHPASESFLQVSKWNSKSIRGIWYSKSFGRVGTVELLRGQIPLVAEEARFMPSISGSYKNEHTRFNLLATADISERADSFFPLSVKGIVSDLKGKDRARVIEGVSYDFFTGKIAFMVDDGRVSVGEVTSSGLKIFSPKLARYGSVLEDRIMEAYEYNKDPFQGVTAEKMFDLFKKGSTGKLLETF
jgi:hypothetical protein